MTYNFGPVDDFCSVRHDKNWRPNGNVYLSFVMAQDISPLFFLLALEYGTHLILVLSLLLKEQCVFIVIIIMRRFLTFLFLFECRSTAACDCP